MLQSGVGTTTRHQNPPPPPGDIPATPYPVVLEVMRDHGGAEGPGGVNTAACVVDLQGEGQEAEGGEPERQTEGEETQ